MDESTHNLEDLRNDSCRLDRLYNEFAKRHGETYLSLATLEILYDHPEGVSQKQISQEVFASKQTVNSMMGNFEKRGIVEHHPSPEDGRSKIHVLTETGKVHAAETVGTLRAIDLEVAEEIGAEGLRHVHLVAMQYAERFKRLMDGNAADASR